MNVGVLDGTALGTVEIVPAHEFYDYEAKYPPGSTQYLVPARLSPRRRRGSAATPGRPPGARLRRRGPRGPHRRRDGTPYILEVNTLPGMTGTSLVPKIAAGKGIPFPELCERILAGASLKA